ncbi:FAD/NAD(P)-binding domain-containing protein [Polyporus arcularius HHB13444]|uniref:FAD/NAD(P)-binding domain-containing protein n=1 Tax=Polyporus arcularius HHB13444 TaxID=1314778 RepID=A0A5C3PY68_9APHY|nr:FAD/NAD(P)-binding domain-containing protein [Polyporus arcularius HHB13444]
MSSTKAPVSTTKFRVAIVGAGLGGLLLALFLQKYSTDIDVDIYESAAKLAELGAGIGVWPRIAGTRDSAEMALYYRKADEPEEVDVRAIEPALLTFRRSDLQAVLVKHLQAADRIFYSKRLAAYVEPKAGSLDPIVLQFKDGTTATCDLLVGSDGIRSAVRRTMFSELADAAKDNGDSEQAAKLRSMIDPVWSGQVAYRGVVPVDKLEGSAFTDIDKPVIFIGKNKNVISYPISRGEAVNIAAFVRTPGGEGTTYEGPWVTECTGPEVAEKFEGWSSGIQDLLKAMDKPLDWAVHTVRELPTNVSGRVALIGDAAHAMTPHQGSGAGQAIEDGFILATILSHPSVKLSNVSKALKIHDELRRSFAHGVQLASQQNADLYHLYRLGWEHITAAQSSKGDYPREMLDAIGDELESAMRWALHGSILEDQQKALKLLEQL